MKKKIIILTTVFIVAMLGRLIFLELEKRKETISIENIWKTEGRPVDVFTAVKGELDLRVMVSGRYDNGTIVSHIVPEKAKKIKAGQLFVSGADIKGTVKSISKKPMSLSGLHSAVLKVLEGNAKDGEIVRAEIIIRTLNDVVTIPIDCIAEDNTIWVINSGQLMKKKITVAAENRKYAGVSEGLVPGEKVVIIYGDKYIPGEKASVHKERGE